MNLEPLNPEADHDDVVCEKEGEKEDKKGEKEDKKKEEDAPQPAPGAKVNLWCLSQSLESEIQSET